MFTLVDVTVGEEEAVPVTLKEELAAAIARRGDTQPEAGVAMGVTQQRISGWLRGAKPNRSSHAALASYLEVTEEHVRELIARQQADDPLARLTAEVARLRAQVDLLMERAFPTGLQQ